MKKQLWQIGTAVGAFVALAYLAYALTYTLRVGRAYVLGAPAVDKGLQARYQAPAQEPATVEPASTTPSRAGPPEQDSRWANQDDDPVPPQAEPPALRIPPPVLLPESDVGRAIAGIPHEDDCEEGHEPKTATVAYRGPTYDEMRSKLEQAQSSSPTGSRR